MEELIVLYGGKAYRLHQNQVQMDKGGRWVGATPPKAVEHALRGPSMGGELKLLRRFAKNADNEFCFCDCEDHPHCTQACKDWNDWKEAFG